MRGHQLLIVFRRKTYEQSYAGLEVQSACLVCMKLG